MVRKLVEWENVTYPIVNRYLLAQKFQKSFSLSNRCGIHSRLNNLFTHANQTFNAEYELPFDVYETKKKKERCSIYSRFRLTAGSLSIRACPRVQLPFAN